MKKLTFDYNDLLNLQNFSGIVPLFPLPNVVFFPNSLLPLHVFEPRYRQMVDDIIESERIIGMVLLKPGWEKDYYGNPEIFNIACMGKIVSIEEMNEGKSNIVLYGLKRIKINDIVNEIPYRVASVKVLEDVHYQNEEVYQKRLVELISKWNSILGDEQKSHKINIDTTMSIENLTDVLTPSIISNVYQRQELLEEINILKRAERILEQLEIKLEIISITSKKINSILEKRHLN
ncbi:MAG: LON peptidase substrate-binding domain-containing protein [Thermodesulfobacteriota bacterium]